jgi:hypothetical protein
MHWGSTRLGYCAGSTASRNQLFPFDSRQLSARIGANDRALLSARSGWDNRHGRPVFWLQCGRNGRGRQPASPGLSTELSTAWGKPRISSNSGLLLILGAASRSAQLTCRSPRHLSCAGMFGNCAPAPASYRVARLDAPLLFATAFFSVVADPASPAPADSGSLGGTMPYFSRIPTSIFRISCGCSSR